MYKDGDIYNTSKYNKYRDSKVIKESINIKFLMRGDTNVPMGIESIYYV